MSKIRPASAPRVDEGETRQPVAVPARRSRRARGWPPRSRCGKPGRSPCGRSRRPGPPQVCPAAHRSSAGRSRPSPRPPWQWKSTITAGVPAGVEVDAGGDAALQVRQVELLVGRVHAVVGERRSPSARSGTPSASRNVSTTGIVPPERTSTGAAPKPREVGAPRPPGSPDGAVSIRTGGARLADGQPPLDRRRHARAKGARGAGPRSRAAPGRAPAGSRASHSRAPGSPPSRPAPW